MTVKTCAVCSMPLAQASSVVFKDDVLIHTGCWTDGPILAPHADPVTVPADPERADAPCLRDTRR